MRMKTKKMKFKWSAIFMMTMIPAMIWGQPLDLKVEYYDKYGGEMFGMVYDGGYIDISFVASKAGTAELIHVKTNAKWASKDSMEAGEDYKMRLQINSTTPLGDYEFRMGKTVKTFTLEHRILPDNSKTCADTDCEKPNHVCMATVDKPAGDCVVMDEKKCAFRPTVAKMCPSGEPSLCHAIAKGVQDNSWSEYTDGCETGIETASITLTKQENPIPKVSFNKAVNMKDVDGAIVYCPFGGKAYGAALEWSIKGEDNNTIDEGKKPQCKNTVDIAWKNLTGGGSRVVQFVAKMIKAQRQRVKFAFRGVMFDNSIRIEKHTTSPGVVDSINVVVQGDRSSDFSIEGCKCTNRDTKQNLVCNGSTCNVVGADPGTIDCECDNVWRSSAPAQKLVEKMTADITLIGSEILDNTSPKTESDLTSKSGNGTGTTEKPEVGLVGIIVGSIVGAAIVVACVIVIVVSVERRKKKRKEQENLLPIERLQERIEKLRKERQKKRWPIAVPLKGRNRFLADRRDEFFNARQRNFVKEQEDGYDKPKESDVLDGLPGARYKNEKLLKNTQVTVPSMGDKQRSLHMNKMKDALGNWVLICQAPILTQFEAHWEAIWQENVGTLGWVGNVRDENFEHLINMYLPLSAGNSMVFGRFRIYCSMVTKINPGYDLITVEVTRTDPKTKKTEVRKITLVNYLDWPDKQKPPNPSNVAECILFILDLQALAAKDGLGGVMFHCSAGKWRSPTFLAAFLALQTFMKTGTFDLQAIIASVRRCRINAWEVDLDDDDSVKMAFNQYVAISEIVREGLLREYAEEEGIEYKPSDNCAFENPPNETVVFKDVDQFKREAHGDARVGSKPKEPQLAKMSIEDETTKGKPKEPQPAKTWTEDETKKGKPEVKGFDSDVEKMPTSEDYVPISQVIRKMDKGKPLAKMRRRQDSITIDCSQPKEQSKGKPTTKKKSASTATGKKSTISTKTRAK